MSAREFCIWLKGYLDAEVYKEYDNMIPPSDVDKIVLNLARVFEIEDVTFAEVQRLGTPTITT